MNTSVLIGNLTKDPVLSYAPNENSTAVCKFTLAVPRIGNDDSADFIRITVFGKQAESCDRYLAKGDKIAVLGRIQTGNYKNSEGEQVYTTEVIADRVEFLVTGKNKSNVTERPSEPEAEQQMFDELPDTFEAVEDDCPF